MTSDLNSEGNGGDVEWRSEGNVVSGTETSPFLSDTRAPKYPGIKSNHAKTA
jgi:hypothetical protein